MVFDICPRLKKVNLLQGEYSFEKFNVFIIGEGNLFCSSLKILCLMQI